jgi:predicted TIM-barrel fold metal-dependent hydrolase
MDNLYVIDCDAHFTEPPDLWSSRVPRALVERMPVQKTLDGITAWYLDGQPWGTLGGNTLRPGHTKVLGTAYIQPFEDIDKAAWSAKERLELLDEAGIWAQVLYPNGIGFASNHVFAIDDQDQRRVVLQTYNDFLVDVQDESGERLLPQAMLPIWDMNLTVQEMTRLLDKGIRGFTLSDKPEMLGLPDLIQPYFTPMWDLFNESGAVANFHIAAGATRQELDAVRNPEKSLGAPNGGAAPPAWSGFGPQRRQVVVNSQGAMSNMRIIANLCISSLFDRFTRLKVASVESGIGWIPFFMEFLEFLYDEMITTDDERSYAKHRPTEYFREHLYVMFWFEELAVERMLDAIGIDNVLIETDIPHPVSLYPAPLDHIMRVLRGYDAGVIRRVLQDNAARLYRVPLPGTDVNG